MSEPSLKTPALETPPEVESELAGTRNQIPGVAGTHFHRILMLSAKLTHVHAVLLAVYIEVFTLLVLFSWALSMESLDIGLAVGIAFLTMSVIDWVALSQLPRRCRSFGPVAPILLILVPLRAIITIAPLLLPLSSLWIATLVEISNFALTGYVLDSLWGEPFRLVLTKFTLKSPKLKGAPPLRVLHLSDFHIERLTLREEKVLKWMEELRPDLIVYTGDLLNFSYLDDERARADCVKLLSRLHAPLGVYAVPGTPVVDTADVQAAIYPQVPHIRCLKNEAIGVEGYPQIQLIGLTCTHDPTLDAPKLDRTCATVPPEKYTLLLYHSPDLMPEASRAGIDLYLCGHTHGGQIRLPLWGAVVTSSKYGKRYEMGHYQEGNTTLYVSRGIGLEGKGAPRMRFLCPPEVELFELRGE
ncbi:MAG TPA: metallophosphoesterase [Anaerolineae bacterium]|nr:metallophosphoesterase [Anaerolineae bacterium]